MTQVRPDLPRDFVAGHKRRRMMDAMVALVTEKGYEATKIAEVVRRAGVARKTLYDNFDGKEEVFLAALDASFDQLTGAVSEACDDSEEWATGVEAALAAALEFVAEEPAAARLCLVESISATPSSARRYDAAMEEFVAILAGGAPRQRDTPATLAESLIGGVAWILQQRVRREPDTSSPELLPELSKFVLSPYLRVGEVEHPGRRK
jgi:AcrR family transcriptional regulator